MAPATRTMRSMGYGAASIAPPRRIDHFGVKKHRSAATRLHAVRGRHHARRNASINETLIQIKAFGARANEHAECVFRLKHR